MTADDIVVNVRLLPDEEDSHEHPHLTRFQRGKRSEVTGRTLRLRCSPRDTVAALKRRIEDERGFPVETLRRGGSPEGIVLAPDDASLADCGVARSMGVWEHLWEDSAANQAGFAADREKIRGMVVSFMEEHPDVGRRGPAVTGDPEDETRAWDAAKKKERAEMEAAVAAERQKKRTALEQAAAA